MQPEPDVVGHDPVLVREVIENIGSRPGATIVDATLGRGGHAVAIGPLLGPTGTYVGLDVDLRNLRFASERLKPLPCRLRLFEANFADVNEVWKKLECPCIDGVLVDLGVSTNQLFDPDYGLSFAQPMPLDMRLDPSLPQSAA